MGSISPTCQARIVRKQNKVRALQLRIDGLTFQAIAEELGYTNQGNAYRLVAEALDELAAKALENATQLRTLEHERLTGVIRDCDTILLDSKTRAAGKLRALELKVRASESLRKLWGLDAPSKVAPTNPDGTEAYAGLSDAALERELVAALASISGASQ